MIQDLCYYKNIQYDVLVDEHEYDSGSCYFAYCREFGRHGCYGEGSTIEEAIGNFLSEKNYYIEFLFSRGDNIPVPNEKKIYTRYVVESLK